MEKFLDFLSALRTEENAPLVESVAKGYMACFEGEDPLKARLMIRRITEHEARAFSQMHPEIPPERVAMGFVVTDPNGNPILQTIMSLRDAEFVKSNLEKIAEKMVNTISVPVMPPSVFYQSEELQKMPPDIRRIEGGEQQFWLWKRNWDNYINGLRKIFGDRKKFMEKHPYFFK